MGSRRLLENQLPLYIVLYTPAVGWLLILVSFYRSVHSVVCVIALWQESRIIHSTLKITKATTYFDSVTESSLQGLVVCQQRETTIQKLLELAQCENNGQCFLLYHRVVFFLQLLTRISNWSLKSWLSNYIKNFEIKWIADCFTTSKCALNTVWNSYK